jgi:hypothetical protein
MMILERLARKGHRAAAAVLDAYNPDQPRDERGQWGEGGPGSGAASTSEHIASKTYHLKAAEEHHARSEHDAGKAHESAAAYHGNAASPGSGGSASKSYREKIKGLAQQASTKANAESAKLGAKPILQSGGYKGNPAAEGSRAVKEDDRARFNAGPKDPVQGGSGKSREDIGLSSGAGGVGEKPGRRVEGGAKKPLQRGGKKGGGPKGERTKDRIDKSISEGMGRSFHHMASEHAASGRRAIAAKNYDKAAKYYETAGNSGAATNMRWKAIEMRQGKKPESRFEGERIHLPSIEQIKTSIAKVKERTVSNKERGQMSVFQGTTVKGKLQELEATSSKRDNDGGGFMRGMPMGFSFMKTDKGPYRSKK